MHHEFILEKNDYLSKYKNEILSILNSDKKILLDSNPGSGKTSLIVEIAIDLKKTKSKHRIVFCAPYLIIQSQFATSLKEQDFVVDLELNAQSKRKHLIESDTIICSTYQSLKHIVNDLTENDIIVVDEAHSLAYSFPNKEGRNYFEKEVFMLLHTKAKLVFMTGTPNDWITKLFKATRIKATKINEAKAQIDVRTSNAKPIQLAIEFAKYASTKFSRKHLNTIFINSTSECEKINRALSDIGFKSKIITSHHKKEETYKELVERMTVNEDIEFLVCTSVISTGANVKNKKIGMALVLNESNPKEIKQFSKRFRQKLDLPIHVVTKNIVPDNNSLITDARLELDNILSFIHEIKQSKIPNEYKNKLDYSDIGTKESILTALIKRYLMQVFYLEYLESEKYKNPTELAAVLNNYSDIEAKSSNTIDKNKLSKNTNDEVLEAELTAISNDFIKDIEDFSYQIINGNEVDSYSSYRYNNEIGKNIVFKNNVIDEKIKKSLLNPYFDKKILLPVIENYPFIKSLKETIYLTSKLTTRALNKLKLTLFFNNYFCNNFDVIRNNNTGKYSLMLSKNSIPKNKVDKTINNLINIVFSLCLKKDNVPLEELKQKVDAKITFLSNEDFEFQLTDRNGFKKEALRCILDSIFLSKEGTNKKLQQDGTEKSSVIFETDVTADEHLKILYKSFFGVPEILKVIPTKDYILNKHLSDEFYKIASNPQS